MDFRDISIPEKNDKISVKKMSAAFFKQARELSKPDKCIACGKTTTSFCNSHSVPRMFLNSIAEDGKIMQPNRLIGLDIADDYKGIKNSGTFFFICKECDNKLFQTYENRQNITAEKLSDRLLAEIALKNVLLMLSKRTTERTVVQKMSALGIIIGADNVFEAQKLDSRDYMNEMTLCMSISNESTDNFQIVYHEVLPYTTPIAVQTALTIQKDIEGNIINDTTDFSSEIRMQNIHISVFPLDGETVVLMFYHRRDKNYRGLWHQFNCLSSEEKLQYINYQIFKYTENYFFAPSIKEILDDSPKLAQLSKEMNELPNMGLVKPFEILSYQPVRIDEIPNLLSPQYSLESLRK